MGRYKKFGKRKFYGNQFKSVENCPNRSDNGGSPNLTRPNSASESSSAKKLKHIFTDCNDKNSVSDNAVSEVALESMSNAVREAVSESNSTHLTVACDGTWQKRGHTSLNGVVTTTSVNTGKVLDVHTLSKSCNICHGANNFKQHDCSINYDGYSGGMEAAGVVEIFSRSVDRYGAKYTNYLGDGDSKGFQKVKESNVYGKDIEITKLECVGHVQKRMGARLRKLKKDMKGKTLSDGESLTGRGRLTDTEIDLLQQYYGLAIRRNAGKTIKDMQQAIWAIYFHKLSNDDAPQHGLCLPGEDSWCGYHKAQLKGDTYKHEHSLPEAVLLAIKPIFRDLARDDLLSKCLHGKTQNPNESFHHVIWERVPKTVFVQVRTLNIGLYDAVICYNDGCYSRIKVLEKMGLTISGNVKCALMNIDKRRLSEANKRAENMEKEARVRNRIEKRKRESQEEQNQQEYAGDDGELSPGSSTESYPAFAHIGLRENPGKNLNQVNKEITVSRENGIEWNLTESGTDGPALRPIEIYCANPRYRMSCVPHIPYAHRPNHMTPLTIGPYSRQNPYTIAASADSPKALLSVRGETPPPSRSASGAIAETFQHR
ncbi:hypothetical protein ANN_01110 [Periplaneta americana]|uniref:Mutator-like transposase domain-containing protein n=1 Tax=Periplaneta americana TaxID=6978 RepID=A0ABQ8TUC4_PERAM|nr:hypothetical protein ANN_01110 [Periplaneta americana]